MPIKLYQIQFGEELADSIMPKSTHTDVLTEYIMLVGEAPPGTSVNVAGWRIKMLVEAEDGDLATTWAGGTANYDKVWADRLSYTYS